MEIYLRSSFKSLYEEKGKVRWKEDKQKRKKKSVFFKRQNYLRITYIICKIYMFVCIYMILRMPQIYIILNIV